MTARSSEKGEAIIKSLEPDLQPHISYEVVPDISIDGAFDHVSKLRLPNKHQIQSKSDNLRTCQVFQSNHSFDYVVHTASPYSFQVDDPVKDFLDPAIKGTTGLLKSIKAYAPSVKRVVVTSSSAAIINPWKHEKVYDESKWAPFTWDDALKPENAYTASKASFCLLIHCRKEGRKEGVMKNEKMKQIDRLYRNSWNRQLGSLFQRKSQPLTSPPSTTHILSVLSSATFPPWT